MSPPLLSIRNLSVKLKDRSGLFFLRRPFNALQRISFDIHSGETFCLLGESGSGKTTLAWTILGLHPFHGGEMAYNGRPIKAFNDETQRSLRSHAQMVFQDPVGSLNPALSLKRSIEEPLAAKGVGKRDRAAVVSELARQAGLDPGLLERRPKEVSGGQNQRACIARALSTQPELLILDEPLTALDAILRQRMVDLFCRIKAQSTLTYFLITHDLALARQIGTRVAVMYLGTIVEQAPAQAFFTRPCHPYAQALMSSVLTPGFWKGGRILLKGETPSLHSPPPGCAFHPRCSHKMAVCAQTAPPGTDLGNGHVVYCHLVADELSRVN
jgi:peptide/nickel transport system ATP-binding protein